MKDRQVGGREWEFNPKTAEEMVEDGTRRPCLVAGINNSLNAPKILQLIWLR